MMSNQQITMILLLLSLALIHVRGQGTGIVTKLPGCGSSSGCFSDCQGTTCSFIVSWSVNGSNAVYTLIANEAQSSGAWIAVGFSSDKSMGNDDLMGCASTSNGTVVAFTAHNNPYSPPTMYADTEVLLTAGKVENGSLYCTFQRPINASASTQRVAVNTPWNLLFAKGTANINAGQVTISYHQSNRYISFNQLTVTDNVDASQTGSVQNTAQTTPQSITQTTQPSSTGTVTKLPGCGSSSGCFSNCQGTTCSFIVSWSVNGSNAVYTLIANEAQSSGAWIAVGFSADKTMADDDVMGCASDSNGAVVGFTARNNPHSQPTMYNDTEIMLTASRVENGSLYCTFQRPVNGSTNSSQPHRVAVNTPWTLLFAKGDATVTPLTGTTRQVSISRHARNHRYISNDPLKVTDYVDSSLTGSEQTTPQPSAGTVSKVSGCGSSVGCFSDCQGSSCSFIVSWNSIGANAVYTLTANVAQNSGAWIAVGFSNDSLMGNDDVLGCAGDTNGKIVAFSAHNPVRATPVMYTDAAVTLTTGNFIDGVLSCTFQRPISGSTNGRADVNSTRTLLFAKGTGSVSATNAATISYHDGNRYVSDAQVTVNDKVDLGARNLDYPLIKAHGSLMIAAWIFLASIGIVLARYYKPVWKGLICSEKVWFQLHRICMILVFCTTAAGFIIIFIEVDGYSDINESREFLVGHPIIGIIVMILTVLNPVMALFRPHPGTSKRPIFNWAHWFVGTSAHILGVVNIFFGVLLTKSDVPYYLMYILGAYVAWQIFVELLLEAISCFVRRIDRSEAYELSADDNHKQFTAEESSGAILTKRIILVVHCIIVAAFAAVLIGLLATGKKELGED